MSKGYMTVSWGDKIENQVDLDRNQQDGWRASRAQSAPTYSSFSSAPQEQEELMDQWSCSLSNVEAIM